MRRSWRLVSVVTDLKENSVLTNKLLSKSLYVHVLVTFVVTLVGPVLISIAIVC